MNKDVILQFEPSIPKEKISCEITKYINSGGWFTEFKKTEELENRIKEYLGVKHCFMVNNGTISLSLALLALGIKPGDKVVVPVLTMVATANAVRLIGAIPVFCEVSKKNLCMNVLDLRNIIETQDNIEAIIYVSLNGRWDETGELIKVFEYCNKHNIGVVEDSAQAFGSNSYRGKIGNDAHISSFSFSMPKIITTGQGGCLVTNDDNLAIQIKRLKDHGRDKSGGDIHDYFGVNAKFTELQAIVGIEQMKNIKWRTQRKKEIYKIYQENLSNNKNIEFIPTNLNQTVPWFMDIYLKDSYIRDKVIKHLDESNIKTRKIYKPLHKQKTYNSLKTIFIVAENYSSRGFWMPSSLELTNNQVKFICNKIKEIL